MIEKVYLEYFYMVCFIYNKILFQFQRVDSEKKLLIVNAYKSKLESGPQKAKKILAQEISKELGIGVSTVSKTITLYNRFKIVVSPNRLRIRTPSLNAFENSEKNTVRRHIHNIWLKREIPTVDKIYQVISNDGSLPTISRARLFNFLKDMGFRYSQRSVNAAITEKNKIVVWRRRFLEDLRKYQKEGRHIYYLDETCLHASECTIKSPRDAFEKGQTTAGAINPSEKDTHFILFNIGSEDGFVPGALKFIESTINTRDYHDEIKGEQFYQWMQMVVPLLKEKCVIVMNSVSYHSVQIDKAPTSKTKKADIIRWLEDNNEIIDRSMVIPQLLQIVKRIKPFHEKYAIDELAKQHDCIILRLPPHHCELNPMRLAWSSVKEYVKMNNATNDLTNIKQLLINGVKSVDGNMWKKFVSQMKVEEDRFWNMDFIVDDVLSNYVLSTEALSTENVVIEDTSSDESSISSD